MAEQGEQIEFCTLGMFIIDEIHFRPPIEPRYNVLGGAGSYSALGARLFSPPPVSQRVGWIVHAGSDFPVGLRRDLYHWKTSCQIRETPSRLTTRGWNGYGDNEHRGGFQALIVLPHRSDHNNNRPAFKYTTPKLRLDAESLDDGLLLSKSFHLICSASRCVDLVTSINARRRRLTDKDTLYIWEPVPDLCTITELEACLEALKHVDIISPNHMELCSFFGVPPSDADGSINVGQIEKCCAKLIESGIGSGGGGAVVVRAGRNGCYVSSRQHQAWLPAYYGKQQDKVVDPTGGGNTFLGGFAISLARSEDKSNIQAVLEAARCGSVAASFAIEQVGMPVLEYTDENETWNGESVKSRASKYAA